MTVFNALHRILLAILVFIPILPVSVEMRLYMAGGLYLLSHLMVNLVAPATTMLFISLVPQNMRGKFFSVRERYLIFVSSVVNVIFGGVLDEFELHGRAFDGYILMYAIVFMAMLVNLYAYISIKEPYVSQPTCKINLKQLFVMPLKEKRFRKIIILFFLWGLSMNFSNPYFSVYMVSKLKLSYTFITVSGFVNSFFYVITVSIWGKMADKKSFTYTAMLSIALLGITNIIWFFAVGQSVLTYVIVMLVHITGGVAWAGIGISLYNIPYEYTPEEGRTVYLGFNAALSADRVCFVDACIVHGRRNGGLRRLFCRNACNAVPADIFNIGYIHTGHVGYIWFAIIKPKLHGNV
ncbi:MFS transporter [Thermoclostridium stercorarium]|uniref:MFS transporter n=1 Tax=Thermoclostridium stercorarium TaxID=1510 RepID=UPI000B17FA4F|nr:MFS transporter [Thermoclostridium stercorarium]